MDYKYISQLVDRYFQGETTLEEESILRQFFAQKDIPAELMPYRDLFAYQAHELACEPLGDDFDERILSLTEQPVYEARIVAMPSWGNRLGEALRPLFKAAAVVAIILTLGHAAQVPFQDKTADPNNIASGYEKVIFGTNVAFTDSARIDSVKPISQNITPQIR